MTELSPSKNAIQLGFLLHKRPYRNTSSIIEFFTRESGLVSMVAKGAQRRSSPWSHCLSSFNRLELAFVGRTSLKTLTRLSLVGPPVWLTGTALMSGLYVNELLLRLLPREEPCPAIFDDFNAVIHSLQVEALIESALRFFEKSLLEDLGVLALGFESRSGLAVVECGQYWIDDDGGLVRLDTLKVRQPQIKGVQGSTLIALDSEAFLNAQALSESKRFLKAHIQKLLGDVPLKSPLIWRQ